MGLQLWLPLNGNLDNQGLSDAVITNSGATVNSAGKIGKCYSFDGNDDYISINCPDLYQIFTGGSQPFTMAFWVYHGDATRGIIFADYGLTGAINFNVELSIGHLIRFYWAGEPDKYFDSTSAVTLSGWTHITLVYDGTQILCYKNGVLSSNKYSGTLAARNKTSGVFYLGRDNRTGTTVLNGRLNDFRIYDNVLSPEQIKDISRGLILHYPLSGPTDHQAFGDAIEDKATYLIRRTPGYNLINNLYAAGRTTVNNNTVTALLSQNLDTYFHFSCSEPLIAGEKYTLSLNCSGFPSSDNYLDFGIIAQNSGKNIRMKNGYCKVTFSPNSNIAASSKIIVDDLGRGSSGYQDITITDIKLEKGEVETPWIEKNSEFDQIVGGTVAWNQLFDFSGVSRTVTSRGITMVISNGVAVFNGTTETSGAFEFWYRSNKHETIVGHVYMYWVNKVSGTHTGTVNFVLAGVGNATTGTGTTPRIEKAVLASDRYDCYIGAGTSTDYTLQFQVIDLTTLFGPTIADYIYTLETATAGAGVTWFKKLFPKDYYPYCAPTMKSVTGLVSHNTSGFNQFDEVWESGQVNRTTGVNETYSGRSRSKNYIPVLPGKTYYFTPLVTYFVYYDSNKNCIGTSSGGFISPSTITMPTNAAFVRFTVNTSTPSSYCFNISDYKKNGTYEPYVGRSYALDSNVVIRGTWKLDTNDNNKLYCDGDIYSGDGSIVRNYKQVILDGTTNKFNGVFGATNNGYCAYISTGLLGTRKANVICDRFVYRTGSYSDIPLYSFGSSSGANETWSFILPSTVTSLAEANTWLTNNPTTIVVKLDTPTTDTATPFSNPQVCSIEGTEEYVIAEQDGVIIPAGHQTKYLHDVLEGRYHTYEEAVSGMGINDNIEYDVSGYKRNGTKNNITYDSNSPKLSYCSVFNGSNSYIKCNTTDWMVNGAEAMTINYWAYSSDWASYSNRMISCTESGGWNVEPGASGYLRFPRHVYTAADNSSATYQYNNSGIKIADLDAGWHMITLIYDLTGEKIYIDGQLHSSANYTSYGLHYNLNARLYLGCEANSANPTTPYFNGKLSDFRVYYTSLSADDVYELYNAGVVT